MSYTQILCLGPWIRLGSSLLPTGEIPSAISLIRLSVRRGMHTGLACESPLSRFLQAGSSFYGHNVRQLVSGRAFQSTNTPEITSAKRSDPLILRQDFSASMASSNSIAIAVSFENAPLWAMVRW